MGADVGGAGAEEHYIVNCESKYKHDPKVGRGMSESDPPIIELHIRNVGTLMNYNPDPPPPPKKK